LAATRLFEAKMMSYLKEQSRTLLEQALDLALLGDRFVSASTDEADQQAEAKPQTSGQAHRLPPYQ
jgi:hypothetical protein